MILGKPASQLNKLSPSDLQKATVGEGKRQ